MRVRVKLVRPFRDAVGAPEVAFEPRSPTLWTALAELAEVYPALREHLFEAGGPSPYVNVYVNRTPVPLETSSAVALRDGDEVLFLLPLTGGCANV